MKIKVGEGTDYQFNEKFYNYLNKSEKALLIKQNEMFENSKVKIKSKLANNVTNKNFDDGYFTFDINDISSIVKSIYKNFDELNIISFIDVSQNVFKSSCERYMKDSGINYSNTKINDNKPTKKDIKQWLEMFVIGDGLNYIYTNEMFNKEQYFLYQVSNEIMKEINLKSDNLKDIKNYKQFINKNLNMNSTDMLKTYKRIKNRYGYFIDDMETFVAQKANIKALKFLGFDKVVRVAIIDDKTCSRCRKLNGTVYNINDLPQLMIHPNDRCVYLPIKKSKKSGD